MRAAVLSDVHANLEALDAALADAREHRATAFASLGDAIGFNGDPAACVERLLPLVDVAVRGNHEEALLNRGLFGVPLYTAMMDRTAAMLSAESAAPMRMLPLKTQWHGVTLAHASPAQPGEWRRIASIPDARAAFAAFEGNLCFFGHTHRATVFKECGGQISLIPAVYQQDGSCVVPLEANCRYLINPGSVGQPRDLDWRAAYMLYDDEARTVTLRRVAYDVDSAASKISRTGLPARFGDALRRGTTPTGD